MGPCDEYRVKTLRYLDNDLQGQELNDFRTRLEACAGCQASVEAEQGTVAPSASMTAVICDPGCASLSRVCGCYAAHRIKTYRIGLYQSARRMLKRELVNRARRVFSMRVLALVVLLLGFLFAFVPKVMRQVRAASYVKTAAAAHRSYSNGSRPLEFRSSSSELATAWLTDKVPFHFRLPNPQPGSKGTPAYRLTGARLVNYSGSKAALVTYEMGSRTISLLVASSKIRPGGGRGRSPFRETDFSLSGKRRPQGDHVEQSWSLVLSSLQRIRLSTRILPGLSSKHG